MKNTGSFKNILFVTVPALLVIFIILELFFRFVIPASDPPGQYFDEQERMYRYSSVRKSGMITIGRFAGIKAKWDINNMGWNYPVDYSARKDKKLIAVIGDSFIEAFQVDADKNYPFLLRGKLYPDYEVYAFGASGAALSQYLHMARYVDRHFDPDVLIINVVHNDFAQSILEFYSQKSHFMRVSHEKGKHAFVEIPPVLSGEQERFNKIKRLLGRSSLFRYLFINLRIADMLTKHWPGGYFEANVQPEEVRSHEKAIYEATDYLVRKIKEENISRRVIFVLDAPRQAIYSGSLNSSRVLWMHEMMRKICAKRDVGYIDLTEPMKLDFAKNNKRFDSEIDNHWNAYGHKFVADIVYEYLKGRK